jgi:hypothetical protein
MQRRIAGWFGADTKGKLRFIGFHPVEKNWKNQKTMEKNDAVNFDIPGCYFSYVH